MQRAYDDLATGRFTVLADFNTPQQAEMLRVVGPDGGTQHRLQPSVTLVRSRDETGTGSLYVALDDGRDALVLDLAAGRAPHLVRDWSRHSLLLMSLHGPPRGARVEFSVRGGRGTSGDRGMLGWSRTIDVRPGWNLYRLDLAELVDAVDLTDVRTLTWRVPQATARTELHLDDLILADNTRRIYDAPREEGGLYVVERGRSWHVGAHGRFELAFRDGLIVGWRRPVDAAAPRRAGAPVENLTLLSGLGPWPVPLAENWAARRVDPVVYDDPALYAHWGERVATGQSLVEASPLRVVIRGHWRFTDAADGSNRAASGAAPRHDWQYVIYPDGCVYIRTGTASRGRGWAGPSVGYAVALDARAGFSRVVAAPAFASALTPVNFVLLTQRAADRPGLLWAPSDSAVARRQVELVSGDDRRLAVTIGEVPARDPFDMAHLLRVWPHDLDDPARAESMAGDYQNPAEIEVIRGALVTDRPGDLNRDGYNESEGCYELAVRDGLLRFELRPGGWLRHAVRIRIHGVAGRPVSAFANGRVLMQAGRDADGALMLLLPRLLTQPLSVEVTLAGAAPSEEDE